MGALHSASRSITIHMESAESLWVGVVSSVLVAIGFFVSPARVDPDIAIVNRTFGFLTVWIVAGICYLAIRNKIRVKREEWFQTGHTKLSARMVGEQRLEPLSENILRELCDYLGAQAAAFFVDDGVGFKRTGLFAASDASMVPILIKVGEGQVGQAIKDRAVRILEGIPDGYLRIGSTLGSALPKNLIIYPITVDGAVNSVVEIGFLESINADAKELLNRVMPSIGQSIKSARYRARLQELLEETQRQSEELQAQSEELRVSNEELEEQGRALMESQSRMELQQAELEQINSQLEEQTQMLESQKDELATSKVELEKQTIKIQQASRYKSEFLANMSHELRTPLNSSLILSKLLAENREGNLTEEQIKFARTIHSSGNDLLVLINDILDLSKIEAGRLEITPARLSIRSLVDSLEKTFLPIARTKSLVFRCELSGETPNSVVTDSQRLEQILRNLLSNAIKFTEEGEVVLKISPTGSGNLIFDVCDTGIGIANDKLELIFEAFRQADGTTNRRYGGTGLGLSISRQLASLLGGTITVDSQVNIGSTFRLTIPEDVTVVSTSTTTSTQVSTALDTDVLSLANQDVVQTPIASRMPSTLPLRAVIEDDRDVLQSNKRRILIVDDDETFAKILIDLCHEANFQALVATTAEEGVATAIQYLPQAILLDIGLPDQSGLSVLDRLKRDARTRHIPVHVVSGSDYASTALTLGAIGYLLKPV